MGRRRLLLVVGAVALLGVAGFVLWLMSPTPGVTWENFHRLRKGMSSSEVEGLLGKPSLPYEASFDNPRQRQQRIWHGKDVIISLQFDAGQRLLEGVAGSEEFWANAAEADVEEFQLVPGDESLLDRIRRWLHL